MVAPHACDVGPPHCSSCALRLKKNHQKLAHKSLHALDHMHAHLTCENELFEWYPTALRRSHLSCGIPGDTASGGWIMQQRTPPAEEEKFRQMAQQKEKSERRLQVSVGGLLMPFLLLCTPACATMKFWASRAPPDFCSPSPGADRKAFRKLGRLLQQPPGCSHHKQECDTPC
ncbi:hypothetical protein NDU88_003549 [Pleurodeles waltl]|uniref:C2H2-type domain-containing protein n=1 Tax=Pleurodeles waltl TaxID=8319 RepID=A0AAV7TNV4_PLEWA|nr:hypothetical protein NDU88_003549 [Pleurodeles waltl]